MPSSDKADIAIDHHTRSYKDGLVYTVAFFDIQGTGTAVTGATVKCEIYSIDLQAFWNGTNWSAAKQDLAAAEVDATNLPGIYKYDGLAAYNSNGGGVAPSIQPGTSGKKGFIVRWFDATSSGGVGLIGYQFISITDQMFFDNAHGIVNSNVVQIDGDGTAAANCEAYFDGTGYGIQPASAATNTLANVVQISGDATAADNCEAYFDNTGFDASNSSIGNIGAGGITSSSFAAGSITAQAIDADAITAPKIANGAIDAATFASGAITASAIAASAIHANAIDQGAIESTAFASGAITADAIAANAIGASEIANGAIDAATFATGAITADAIASNAIGAAEIADGAIDAATFATGAIDANAIATGAIGHLELDTAAINQLELGSSAVEEIQNAIWNADIWKPIYSVTDSSTSGATAGTMGYSMLLNYLTTNLVQYNASATTPVFAATTTDSTGTKFYSNTISTVAAERTKYLDRTAILIKNWALGDTPGANFKSYLVRIKSVGGTTTSDSYFEISQVDESGSAISGGISSGAAVLIVKAETDATMHEIAHEVWEESVFDHSTEDTFGMFNRIIAGLSQYNHRIEDPQYDQSGRLTACRLVVYPSATDAENKTNALATIAVKSTYDDKQNMSTFVSQRES